jgi:hypothetical protein
MQIIGLIKSNTKLIRSMNVDLGVAFHTVIDWNLHWHG